MSRTKIMFIVLIFILLVGLSGAVYFFYNMTGQDDKKDENSDLPNEQQIQERLISCYAVCDAKGEVAEYDTADGGTRTFVKTDPECIRKCNIDIKNENSSIKLE